MLEFARTAQAIGATSSTLEKSRLLADYLRELPPDDLRLAAVYMTGLPLGRADRRTLKAGWATLARVIEQLSGLDGGRLAGVYRRHADPGDWAEEVLEGRTDPKPAALADIAEAVDEIEAAASADSKGEVLERLLRRLTPLEAKYVVKILTGDLRIGLREGLVEAAIARAFDVDLDQVRRIHMLTGDIGETALRIKRGELATTEVRLFQPIRYMLASPVETASEAMERVGGEAWTEEKYDGVRCQLHVSNGRVMLFSRDLKETTAAFPELAEAGGRLGHELLLDGEVLAHRDGRVLRFFELQHRLGRKDVSAQMRRDVPVVLVVFDLLVLDGQSLLELPLAERRRRLEQLNLDHPFLLARREFAANADDLDRIFAETRERGNEGLMVKDPGSPYTPGRRGLAWLKLKRPLATLDVVVTAVEWGHGKRRGVLSDYTFGVLDEDTGRPVNVGKAYTGLTDAEIARMTEHFLARTVEDRGWVRTVELDTVVEVAFDSIQKSTRHRSGYALRFPRIVRLRPDKPVSEIDTLRRVEELYERFFGERSEIALSEVADVRGPHEGPRLRGVKP